MAKLKTYRAKRDFGKTSEPRGAAGRKKGKSRYVIQKHAATRLHYDLRLELDGVMLSWAVTRGPSLVPGDKRLAIHVEDHPIEYNTFEGTIPKGQYGGGTVMIWDRGTWTPEDDPRQGHEEGPSRLRAARREAARAAGTWCACSKRPGERQEPWLLIKATDEYARTQIRSRHSGRDAELGGDRPHHGRDRRRQEDGSGIRTSRPSEQSSQARRTEAEAARARLRASKRAKRARSRARKAAQRRRIRRPYDTPRRISGARRTALPDFVEPSLATLERQRARRRRLGP